MTKIMEIDEESALSDHNEVKIIKTKSENKTFALLGAPPDKGYSWIILLCSLLITVIFSSIAPSFGILFAHKVRSLELSSFNVALTFSLLSFLWNVAATMSGPLCEEFGWRIISAIGCFSVFLSILTTCYATCAIYIYLSFSMLLGIGGGLIYSVSLYAVSQYFLKLRGVAMAIYGSGIGIGQMVLPIFMRYLQTNYGFNGAALIFSAFTLHGLIAAMLFHPIKTHKSRPSNGLVSKRESLQNDEDKQEKENFIDASDSKVQNESVYQKFKKIFTNISKLTYKNITNLKSPVVLILALSGSSSLVGFLNILLMVPLAFISQGFTLQQAAYCFSISGISNIVARLIVPSLTDLPFVNVTYCYLIGEFLVASSALAFSFLSDYTVICVCFIVLGIGMGTAMGLQPIILIDYRDVDSLPRTYGSFGFLCAVLFITIGPSVGYIRDITKSYFVIYRIFSGVLYFSVFIWIFMPISLKYERKSSYNFQ